ncbi:winged helix-turn-helix domain-containing protein [Chelatococcus asaccharovorans]|uniref:Molybdate transport system regulatory protein n=1 Tax=Chelatococcus asaccharovorans TaxID=28210 RepID=A0A2V3UB70_9HYPH|nr:winged helix-turn-helix domain-containing protein [Chelatococcus asaccharovorans]MBS7703359.1 winged helix-turn-helix domain-containing protein [Chelatococcus asaccharovorans]PXW61697.1 molybdate transport system regulatory protein [Chelatococcus asaccharovorans]
MANSKTAAAPHSAAPSPARGVTRLTHNPAGPAGRLTIRVDLGSQGALGPGKVRLMELIAETGSISAAGRAMEMSYRRAWLLIDSLNRAFRTPVVATQHGGSRGGGAVLTPLGQDLVARYRRLERNAHKAVADDLDAFAEALAAD